MADDSLAQQERASRSASPPTSSDQQQPPPLRPSESRRRAKRSCNPARERLQSELKHLRVLSTELEQRLASLQQHQEHDVELINKDMLMAWEYVNRRQLHERTRVEQVNAQLRAHVQSNVDTIKRLQHTLFQAPGLQRHRPVSFAEIFELSPEFPRQTCTAPEEIAVYERLASQVDAAFARMESVFKRNGLSAWRALDASELATQARMRSQRSQPVGDGRSLAIELIDADVFPFAKDSVFRAMWHCWKQQYMTKNAVVYEFKTSPWSNNTIAGRMDFAAVVDDHPVALQSAFLVKWMIEDERICYVWQATTTADESLAGVCVDETGWEEIRTVHAQDDGAVEGTLVLSCSRLESKSLVLNPSSSLNSSDDITSQVAVATPLASALISSYEADLVDVSCLMMDLLLDETDGASVAV